MKIILTFITLILLAKQTFANPIACPVCTIVIVSGLGISRALGINDCIIGLWTGAMLIAISNGCIVYLKNKKNINNKILNIAIYLLTYSILIPLYIGKTASIKFNMKKIFFLDEFLFSVLLGSLILFITSKLYYYTKNKNGKPHFPFEKVVLPVTTLFIFSILLYFKRG